ncbi:MAG: DMT family transporter, partial [Candidatus Poseidoniaceae archaeon]
MNLFWLHTRLLIVAIIWGLGWTAGRVVATDFPPITAAWIRYIIAVAMFLVWLKMTGKFRIPTEEEWKRLFYIGFFSTFLYQAFFMYGMRYTAAGDASLMITFNPIIR